MLVIASYVMIIIQYNTHTPQNSKYLGVGDYDILRSSRFWNITYYDYENNHDYKILTIFDVNFMQQVMPD